MTMPGHAVLAIRRDGAGDRLRVLAAGGTPVDPLALPHRVLAAGGTLRFTVKAAPEKP